jgi:glutathione S-transferase
MMKLRSSPPSPFGRKIKLAMEALGLRDRIMIEEANTADPSDSLRSQNPLGKIPALILDNGEVLFDSSVILEYLDWLAGGNKLFPSGEVRFAALRDQTLADGIMDAAILRVYEKRFKEPQFRDPDWDAYQAAKMERGLAYFEANLPPVPASTTDITASSLTLACALGYLDMRFGDGWRQNYPKQAAWVDAFEAAVPYFSETKQPPALVPDDAHAPLR